MLDELYAMYQQQLDEVKLMRAMLGDGDMPEEHVIFTLLKSHLAISHKDPALDITPCDFTQRNHARRSEPGAILCLVPVTTVKMY